MCSTVATDILRINNFHVATTGTGLAAAGNIDVRHLSDAPLYGRIAAEENLARQAIYTVPLAHTLYITAWQVGVGHQTGNRFARFELEATRHPDGTLAVGLFHHLDIIHIQDGNAPVPFSMPFKIPAKADVQIFTVSDSNVANAQCAGHFEGWIETEG